MREHRKQSLFAVLLTCALFIGGQAVALESVVITEQENHYEVSAGTESDINDEVGESTLLCRTVGNSSLYKLFVPTNWRSGFASEWQSFITAGEAENIPDALVYTCGSCDPNFGTSCVSEPNECGQRDTSAGGTIRCDGSCSLQPPAAPGIQECNNSNSCGMNGPGGFTDVCGLNCDDVAPSDNQCVEGEGSACPVTGSCGTYEGVLECVPQVWNPATSMWEPEDPCTCNPTEPLPEPDPNFGNSCSNSCGNTGTYSYCGDCDAVYNPTCPDPGCGVSDGCGGTCGTYDPGICAP